MTAEDKHVADEAARIEYILKTAAQVATVLTEVYESTDQGAYNLAKQAVKIATACWLDAHEASSEVGRLVNRRDRVQAQQKPDEEPVRIVT